MDFPTLVHRIDVVARKHSPAILSAFGVSGVLSTVYLTGKASFTAAEIIASEQRTQSEPLEFQQKVKLVWKQYIPAAISIGLTVTCIVAATRIGSRRTAAIASAYSISEKAFTEYKDKVVEQIGPKKEAGIREQIALDRVTGQQPIIVAGSGNVMCYEMHTGRYFQSDVESLKKAQNDINALMIRENEARLYDLYYMLGLPQTSHSSYMGWTNEKMLEISFSAVMAEGNRPCIAFEYNYIKPLK